MGITAARDEGAELAAEKMIGALPRLDNLARYLKAKNIGRSRRRRIEAPALEHIGPVHACRGDPDQDFILSRSWNRPLDNGKLRADAVKDIGALLDWIRDQADLDGKRVGVIGGSYGGFMSLAVQTTYNDRIRAGIDIVGISNFVSFLKNTQAYRRDLRRAEYGDERDEAMRAFLERVSPLTHVAKIRTPILVVQGQNDPRVPISEAAQVVAAVRKNGMPVWYVVGTNEGHGFAKRPNQDYLQAVEVLFLRTHLLGETP